MTVAQPLIELDASYARAVPRLSVPWTAAPVPAPELLLLNAELAEELDLDPAALRAPAGGGAPDRPRAPRGGHHGRAGLRGPPVRLLPAPPRRRQGVAARRGRRPLGPAARPAPEGAPGAHRSPAAETAGPRWARCCASTSSARRCTRSGIPTTRGLSGRRHRRAGAARAAPARRGALPGGREPPAGGHVPVRRRPPATPACCAPSPTTPSPATTPTPPRGEPVPRAVPAGHRRAGRARWPAGCSSGSCTA
jgi:hypothetical protein